jgi:hypothetical protein
MGGGPPRGLRNGIMLIEALKYTPVHDPLCWLAGAACCPDSDIDGRFGRSTTCCRTPGPDGGGDLRRRFAEHRS